MSNIENSICEAIELIVNKSVANAGYDKTIQAIVQSCADATVGKYKIKYQDSSFYAYATNADVTYTPGATVYILVPGNDMTRDKTILGTVEKLGINYVTQAEGDEAYDINGTNCINSSNIYKLSSYRNHNSPSNATEENRTSYIEVIYSDKFSRLNLSVDKESLNQYIKESSSLVCGGFFKTNLPPEQQYQGNYGIIFGLDFYDNANGNEKGEIVTRYYTVDVDNMTGNPYNLNLGKRQYGIFDIDGANFVKLSSISLFVKDFPNHKTDDEIAKQNLFDIEVSQIELSGATLMSESERNGCGISFYTPDGSFFSGTAADSATLRLIAKVKMKGKPVDSKFQKIPFYWFQEDLSIVPKSTDYNKYGGRGWRCLNDKNIIEEAHDNIPQQVEWIPSTDTYIVKIADLYARAIRYKCVIIYDGTVYSKIITIKNLRSNTEITIESDLGTKFYYDIGRPTLTCYVNGIKDDNYTYIWAREDAYGNLLNLPENQVKNDADNTAFVKAQTALKNLEDDIKNGTRFANEASTELSQKRASIDAFKNIQCVVGNQIQRVAVNEITNFVRYKCSVFTEQGFYLGTASITLTNKFEIENAYTLVINNGTQTYQYDEFGVSPASPSVEKPINIPVLSFSIFDNLGNLLDEDILKNCTIKWKVPIEYTMLTEVIGDSSSVEITPDKQYKYYNNATQIIYSIENKYHYNYKNNDIELEVDYKGMNLTAKTNLTFVKQGESGTNGTDYTCKIVPNSNQSNLPFYPILTLAQNDNGKFTSGYFNFKHDDNDASNIYIGSGEGTYSPFLINLYKAGTLIYSGNQSGSTLADETGESTVVNVKWEMLKNHYKTNVEDSSDLTINENNGKIKYIGTAYNKGLIPANIIKCTIYYDNKTTDNKNNNRYCLSATLPIIIARVSDSKYHIRLKDNTGFTSVIYTSDGKRPKYNTEHPFEIEVLENINGTDEVVSMINGSHAITDFKWSKQGGIYDYSKKTFVSVDDLIHQDSDVYTKKWEKNQRGFKPNPSYDGLCVTNAVICSCGKAGKIHIPIHFMLNKYGLSHLNGWDGNSINIDDEGGFILSPQMGAGIKESDNSFTGVLMGKVQEPEKSKSDIGVLGYHKGTRSFKLDSNTGAALFGAGNGSIIIDPAQKEGKNGRALLYSNEYWKSYDEDRYPTSYADSNINRPDAKVSSDERNQKGMLIDLTTPKIDFANTNFSVDEKGFLTAKGGGHIAGWEIKDHELHSDDIKTGMNSMSDVNGVEAKTVDAPLPSGDSKKAIAFWAGGTSKPKFYVTHDGYLRCNDATIGSGSNKIYIGKSGNNSALYTSNKENLLDSSSGFYLGVDGFALGSTHTIKYYKEGQNNIIDKTVSRFQIDDNGTFYAKEGYIGSSNNGWYIGSRMLRNGLKSNYNDTNHNGVYIGTDGIGLGTDNFYVSNSGNLYAKLGTVGGWRLSNNCIRSIDSAEFNNTNGMYFGSSGLRLGSTFSVNSGGYLKATNGQIAGWTIGSDALTGGGLTLKKDGSLKGNNWSINANGKATFTNAYISGGKITLGGTTLTGGGGTNLTSGSTTVGYGGSSYGLSSYVKKLAVESLNVSDSLTFQGRSCKWRTIRAISGITYNINVCTGVLITSVSKLGTISSYRAGVKFAANYYGDAIFNKLGYNYKNTWVMASQQGSTYESAVHG